MSHHLLMPLAVLMMLVVMVVPLPPRVLDILITLNLTLSMVVLLVSLYIDHPTRFSVFPPLLLIITLFRLSLNVASTRLILLHGPEGTTAAGQVIRSFGEFVVGGSYVVGAVVFIVLIVIQYVVINHGAVRVSEVIARFTLDAMPGKQMSIDADLSAGLIDEAEAQERRRKISREAEFYGSMDGAVRFSQRDAIAAIIITIINIIAGLSLGVLQHGMELSDAARNFTMLTIGDGLVTAIPALLISVSGGIVTTRATAEASMGEDVAGQLLVDPRPLFMGAGVLGGLALVPGLPKLSFILLAATLGYVGVLSRRAAGESKPKAPSETTKEAKEERVEALLQLDVLELTLGFGLVPFAEKDAPGGILDRIRAVRKQMALEMGFVIPPIRVRDNLELGQREYAILLKGSTVARGELFPGRLLALQADPTAEPLDGVRTTDPAFGLPAFWIEEGMRAEAQAQGYTVVDPLTVLTTHLTETVRKHMWELLGRQETQSLLDNLARTHPRVVEELVPGVLTLGQVQKVLQMLLRERVPIRDLLTITESLADHAPATKDLELLASVVRQSLSRAICGLYQNENGELMVLTVSPDLENEVVTNINKSEGAEILSISPEKARDVVSRLNKAVEGAALQSSAVFLCSGQIRRHLRALTERFLPNVVFLSHAEIAPGTRVVSLGVVN